MRNIYKTIKGFHRPYNYYYAVYDALYEPMLRTGRVNLWARLAPAAGEKVLEVGCGTGLSFRYLPPGVKYAGVDLTDNMLGIAERRLAKLPPRDWALYQMNGLKLGFKDDTFDVVAVPFVLTVVGDPPALIREAARVLKPGGRLGVANHFLSENNLFYRVLEKGLSPLFQVTVGYTTHLRERDAFVDLGVEMTGQSVPDALRLETITMFAKSPSRNGHGG